MELKMNMLSVLLILTSIDRSFSAVFLTFENEMPRDYYFNSRGASDHRGLLLSFSSAEKNKMCWDLYSENFNALAQTTGLLAAFRSGSKPKITDDDTNVGAPKHSLIVGRISVISKLFRPVDTYKDLFFKCTLLLKDPIDVASGEESSNKAEYYLSSAFRSGIMYAGLKEYTYENVINVALMNYMLISPEFVSLGQNQLEKQYVMTRLRMGALETESEEYIKLIEHRDNIAELSPWQTFLLCSSIVSTPNRGKNDYKFFLDKAKHKENAGKPDIPRFVNRPLVFRSDDLKNRKLTVDCVNCWATAQTGNIFKTTINLFFARAYDDKYSVYVLAEINNIMYLSDYIKNVPILRNVRVPITNDPPTDEPVSHETH